MRLTYDTQAEAKSKTDAIHAWMLANNEAYRQSAEAGQTTGWAIPYQDTDEAGNVISPKWHVNVKERCMGALTESEIRGLKK